MDQLTSSIVTTLKEHEQKIQMIENHKVSDRILIYVASPYSIGSEADNVRRSLEFGMWLRRPVSGNVAKRIKVEAYLPLLSHFDHFFNPRPYHEWIEMCTEFMVPRCDMLVRLTGESKGADKELNQARKLLIPTLVQDGKLSDREFAFVVHREILTKYILS